MTEKQNITASFTDATWNDPNHKSFRVIVTLSNGDVYPFTYLIDGSDDNDGSQANPVATIAKAIELWYNIKVRVFPGRDSPLRALHECSDILITRRG